MPGRQGLSEVPMEGNNVMPYVKYTPHACNMLKYTRVSIVCTPCHPAWMECIWLGHVPGVWLSLQTVNLQSLQTKYRFNNGRRQQAKIFNLTIACRQSVPLRRQQEFNNGYRYRYPQPDSPTHSHTYLVSISPHCTAW